MTSDAFIADPTMFRPERLTRHALYAERLSIEPAFRSQIFDDLFDLSKKRRRDHGTHTHRLEFRIAGRFRARPRIKTDCSEKVVGAQAVGQSKDEVCERMILRF